MTRRLFIILVLLAAVTGISAQELTVEGMELSGSDISASTDRRTDKKGKLCALVKVQLAAQGATFEGNVVPPAEFKQGEYWVYMSDGSSQLTIKLKDYPTLVVNFLDYAIDAVRSLTTYTLTINVPSGGDVDDGKRYLQLGVETPYVKVFVDGQEYQLNESRVNVLLSRGMHTYRVEKPEYETLEETVEIGDDIVSRWVKLKKSKVNVTFTCPTPGAKFYIANKECGSSPWTTQMDAGDTWIDARLDGHRTKNLKVTLSKKDGDNQTVKFPALEPIEGSIRVDFTPAGCEVLVDGKRLGTSPGLFSHQLIGRHVVEVQKEGYLTEMAELTVTEGQQANFNGKLLKKGTADMSASQMIQLAQDYENGTNGKEADFAKAAQLYKKAAELGNAKAQCLWGEMLENGRGVQKDPVEAVRWYRKSAEQGNPDGQYRLGMSYEIGYGRGLTPDRNTAYQWYQKAAAQGHGRAQELIYKQQLRQQYGGRRR